MHASTSLLVISGSRAEWPLVGMMWKSQFLSAWGPARPSSHTSPRRCAWGQPHWTRTAPARARGAPAPFASPTPTLPGTPGRTAARATARGSLRTSLPSASACASHAHPSPRRRNAYALHDGRGDVGNLVRVIDQLAVRFEPAAVHKVVADGPPTSRDAPDLWHRRQLHDRAKRALLNPPSPPARTTRCEQRHTPKRHRSPS